MSAGRTARRILLDVWVQLKICGLEKELIDFINISKQILNNLST